MAPANRDWLKEYPKGVPADVDVKKDSTLGEEQVREHCRANLTGYKVPKHYAFIEALPKTNVGKILRKELRGR